MWDNLMKRISLIDGFTVDCAAKTIQLKALAIGQLRVKPLGFKEYLSVEWFYNGKKEFADQFVIQPNKRGTWKAVVKYTTEERRSEPIQSQMEIEYNCSE
jgi:hypothetical protein